MSTGNTTLLKLVLPVEGELDGTWEVVHLWNLTKLHQVAHFVYGAKYNYCTTDTKKVKI